MPGSLLLISVGNTRTRFCGAAGGRLDPSHVLPNDDLPAIVSALQAAIPADAGDEPVAVVASVNHPVADKLESHLTAAGFRVTRFGRDLPIPILNSLSDDTTVGQDRLLDALGAFTRSGQACIVIDAGTAVTVDFIDGEGVFHGGAIGPGMQMMLRSLNEHTAALPVVHVTPDMLPRIGADGKLAIPFGKDTRHAIAIGVASAVRGMAHLLIDRYAEFYEAYPRVIATGGDAPLLFENDPLVEVIVPDLTLVGMLAAVQKLDELDGAEDDDDRSDESSSER